MTTAPVGRQAQHPRGPRMGRASTARLPRLVLVPASQHRSRVPFALVVLFLIGSGLIGLLLLNTVLAQDAFVLFQLRQQTAVLVDRQQQLQQAVDDWEAPAALASRAASLGMVPGGNPLFLRLSDGAVLGDPKAAGGTAPVPTTRASISPTPTLSPSATPTGSASLKSSLRSTVNRTVRPGATSPGHAARPTAGSTPRSTTGKPAGESPAPTPTPSGTRR